MAVYLKILIFSYSILITLIFSNSFVQAQVFKQQISGRIIDSINDRAVSDVNIVIVKDEVEYSGIISDKKGNFSFSSTTVPNKSLSIKISHIGYEPKVLIVSNPFEHKISLDIEINKAVIKLDEISIKNNEKDIIIKLDTIDYNAKKYKYRKYDDADVILLQLPGVRIDENGNFMINGQDVYRVTVDGREFFSSDPKTVLKILPAEAIDRVQVIDAKTDEDKFTGYDSGERVKEINVVLKEDMRKGFFGKGYFGLGTDKRNDFGTTLNLFDDKNRASVIYNNNNIGGQFSSLGFGPQISNMPTNPYSNNGLWKYNNINFNFNREFKGNISVVMEGKYNGNNSYIFHTNRKDFFVDNQIFQLSSDTSQSQTEELNINLKIQKNSKNSKLYINPNINLTNNQIGSNSITTTFTEGSKSNNGSIINETKIKSIAVNSLIMYNLSLNNLGRNVSIILNNSNNVYKSNGLITTNMMYYGSDILRSNINVKNINKILGGNHSMEILFNESINKTSNIQFRYNLNYFNATNRNEAYNSDEQSNLQYSVIDSNLSSRFHTKLFSSNYTLGYTAKISDKLTSIISLGIQSQKLVNDETFGNLSKVDKRYNSFIPNLTLNALLSDRTQVQFRYSTHTNIPDGTLLREAPNIVNPLNIFIGNIKLEQEYIHNVDVSIDKVSKNKKSTNTISLNYKLTNNKIINGVNFIDKDSLMYDGSLSFGKGTRITRPINRGQSQVLNLNYEGRRYVFNEKMTLEGSLSPSYNKDLISINDDITSIGRIEINTRIGFGNMSNVYRFNVGYQHQLASSKNIIDQDHKNWTIFQRHRLSSDVMLIMGHGLEFNSNLHFYYTNSLINSAYKSFAIWNISLGKRIMKGGRGLIQVAVYDALNQSKSETVNFANTYRENIRTNIIGKYYIFSFMYNFRRFGDFFK